MKTKKVFLAIITTVVMICSSYEVSRTETVYGGCIDAYATNHLGGITIHIKCGILNAPCVSWGTGLIYWTNYLWVGCWAKPSTIGVDNENNALLHRQRDRFVTRGNMRVDEIPATPPLVNVRQIEVTITDAE